MTNNARKDFKGRVRLYRKRTSTLKTPEVADSEASLVMVVTGHLEVETG